MDTMAEAQKWKDQFLNDPVARNVVKLYAFGRMSESEAMAKVPGFNKQSGPARLALTYAAVELNPPQFDENANLIGGFDPRKFAVGRAEEMAEASKQGQLKDEIIEKEAKKTYATTLASQNAQLDPGIVERKIDKQARGVTAGTLLKQRMAAQRAISTFKDSLNQFGKYENIPQWMYRDLASDYAKILQATGQIAEGSVDKVMQLSLSGNVVGLWNFLTGDTKTTAPHKVLKLMYDRINALRVDLDKQYYNQTKGENIPINSDEGTNPFKTEEPEEPKPKTSNVKKKIWNNKTGKFEWQTQAQ
jgi:hypothetical protein